MGKQSLSEEIFNGINRELDFALNLLSKVLLTESL